MDSNPRPFDHGSDALTAELSPLTCHHPRMLKKLAPCQKCWFCTTSLCPWGYKWSSNLPLKHCSCGDWRTIHATNVKHCRCGGWRAIYTTNVKHCSCGDWRAIHTTNVKHCRCGDWRAVHSTNLWNTADVAIGEQFTLQRLRWAYMKTLIFIRFIPSVQAENSAPTPSFSETVRHRISC